MLKLAADLCFQIEPIDHGFATVEVFPEDLQCDFASKVEVDRGEDAPISSPGQLRENPVPPGRQWSRNSLSLEAGGQSSVTAKHLGFE